MNRFLKGSAVLAGLIFACFTASYSQDLAAAEAENSQYIAVLKKRAEKIVSTLDVTDEVKKHTVRDLIVMQYYNLSKIHDERDKRIEALQKQNKEEEQDLNAKVRPIKIKAEKKLDKLHKRYIEALSAELSTEQIDKVKDGMTYGVVPITYKGYLNLLPDLTTEQKEKIRAYLVEAREHAMDAGSSEEKHHWFGKYKGKINNYLSANGYDLKAAEKALEARNNK